MSRTRTPSRRRPRLPALVIVAALLIMTALLSGRAGTWARWSDAAPLGAGEVHSGRLVLRAGDGTIAVAAYPFDALAAPALRPGGSAQAPLMISNAGTVALRYRLSGTTTNGTAALAGAMTLRVDRVDSPAACPAAVDTAGPSPVAATLYTGPLVGAAAATSVPVATGGQDVLCVRAALPAAAPATVQGATRVTLVFQAVQA